MSKSSHYATVAEGRKIRIILVEIGKPGTLTLADGRTVKTSFTQTPTDETFTSQRAANARMCELNGVANV